MSKRLHERKQIIEPRVGLESRGRMKRDSQTHFFVRLALHSGQQSSRCNNRTNNQIPMSLKAKREILRSRCWSLLTMWVEWMRAGHKTRHSGHTFEVCPNRRAWPTRFHLWVKGDCSFGKRDKTTRETDLDRASLLWPKDRFFFSNRVGMKQTWKNRTNDEVTPTKRLRRTSGWVSTTSFLLK